MFPFHALPWARLIAPTLVVTLATATLADDVFVEQGVVVKPLSKFKQRRLEKKLTRRPGNQVVIEGTPTATPGPEVIAGRKVRRSFRPLFPDRFGRRNELGLGSTVVTTPSVTTITNAARPVVGSPGLRGAPGDPLVVPGSVEVTPMPRVVRPPIVSTPRGPVTPVDPGAEPALEPERAPSARTLPPLANEIPAPIISTPRPPVAPAAPAPAPTPPVAPEAALPPMDPGPDPASPPAPAAEPVAAPSPAPPLDSPLEPRST